MRLQIPPPETRRPFAGLLNATLDSLLATAIGAGLAAALVAWWTT